MAVARSDMAREIPEAADREYGRFGRPNGLSLSRRVPSHPSGRAARPLLPPKLMPAAAVPPHTSELSEALQRRANERHAVGCCEELARCVKNGDRHTAGLYPCRDHMRSIVVFVCSVL